MRWPWSKKPKRSHVVTGNLFGKEVADLLGLKHTRNITIRMHYDEFVMVNVEMLLDEGDSRKVIAFLSRGNYRLVEDGEPEITDIRRDVRVRETTQHGDTHRTFVPDEETSAKWRESGSPPWANA